MEHGSDGSGGSGQISRGGGEPEIRMKLKEEIMNTAEPGLLHGDVTEQIIKSYYHVYNTLGYGFLEKVYENALAATLRKRGFGVVQQMPEKVYFEGVLVGEYFADLIVNACVIVEVKAAESIHSAHEAQLVNYLKATPIEV